MKIVLDDGAFKPYKAHPEDAGFDIMARERQIVPAQGSAIFDTGVHIEIPSGYVGFLKSKSGLNVKHCNGMFYVEYIESGDKITLSAMDGYMKIIGNIYDNPELLGGNG